MLHYVLAGSYVSMLIGPKQIPLFSILCTLYHEFQIGSRNQRICICSGDNLRILAFDELIQLTKRDNAIEVRSWAGILWGAAGTGDLSKKPACTWYSISDGYTFPGYRSSLSACLRQCRKGLRKCSGQHTSGEHTEHEAGCGNGENGGSLGIQLSKEDILCALNNDLADDGGAAHSGLPEGHTENMVQADARIADRKCAEYAAFGFPVRFSSRFPNSIARKNDAKKRKVNELYFNEYDSLSEIHTCNTKRKKRLTAYTATYPGLCQMIKDDGNGGLRFEIDKHRISIRLTAPYSQERINAASQQASKNITPFSSIYAAQVV